MRLKNLFLLFALGAAASLTAQDLKPEFVKLPTMFHKLSNNGKWAIAEKASTTDGSIAPSGGAIYNVETLESTDISHESGLSGVADITDDGTTVVGEVTGKPAIWNAQEGWIALPTPEGYTNGRLLAVTPDGHYAVGYVIPPTFDWGAYPVMYDLTTRTLMDLSGIPTKDMENEDKLQNCIYDVSPDGRYVVGSISQSYILPAALCAYVFDRQEKTYHYIGFNENPNGKWTAKVDNLFFIDGPSFSPNGEWVTGTAYMVEEIAGVEWPNEYRATFRYNVATDETEVWNAEGENDIVGYEVFNNGCVLGVTPAENPYASTMIRSGNYFVSLMDVFEQVYGVNYKNETGYENTGKPLSVSEDGKTLIMLPNTSDTYLLRLKEPIYDAAAKVSLLGSYKVTPPDGTVMNRLSSVEITFDRNVETNGFYNKIFCKSEDGTESFNPVQTNGFVADGKKVTITFRGRTLREGVKYTINIPAGLIRVKGDRNSTSGEINITFTGRSESPMAPVTAYPADGAAVATLDATANPILLTFGADVKVADSTTGHLYRVGEDEPFCDLSVAYGGKQIMLFPLSAQHLFSGTDYKVVLPAGSVTDLSGNGANEEITLTYHGSYVREVSSDDKYLFQSNCGNYDSFIFFEGDHLTPEATVAGWGFTANIPWYIVRSSSETTDMAMAAHSMYTEGGKADDWMSTPQLFIPDVDCFLSFDAQSYLKSKNDRLKVYVYESRNVYNTFTREIVDDILANGHLVFDQQLSAGESEEGLENDWEHYNVSLADFAGKDVYIAFVNDNQAQSAVFLDNIEVIHDLTFLTTFEHRSRVVNQNGINIKGNITLAYDMPGEDKISLVLRDADGSELDTLTEEGLDLSKGFVYNFEFANALPLETGKITPFSVDVTVGSKTTTINSEVRNLTFEPVKKIVIEEFSGSDCSNCPLGIVAMENLERLYPENVIPVCLRAYGGDRNGNGIGGYASFLDMSAAPSARINRGGIVFPMVSNEGDYLFSGAGLKDSTTGEDITTWLDVFQKELAQPADAEVTFSSAYDESTKTATVHAKVRNALNTTNTSINVFAVVVENGVTTYQCNGFSSVEDPDLGEWGKGGSLGKSTIYPYVINDVARNAYGTTYNGTGGLVPDAMTAGEEYPVTLSLALPETVVKPENCEVVLMLIDPATGLVLNSNRAPVNGDTSAIRDAVATDSNIAVTAAAGKVIIAAAGAEIEADIYAPDGSLIAKASGTETAVADLNGYTGVAVVAARAGEATSTTKIIIK